MLCGFRTPGGFVLPIRTCRRPDGRGSATCENFPTARRFANDSRGFLYLIDQNNRPQVYADVSEAFPYGVRHLLKLLSRRSGQ